MTRLAAITMVLGLAACGDDGGTPTPGTPDGSTGNDVQTSSKIEEVTCPGTPAATITNPASPSDYRYVPNAVTISVGEVVKFELTNSHDVAPNTGAPTELRVGFGGTKCFMFKEAGTYPFYCTPHGFTGTITVQ